jgi:hypothetical protein
MLGLTKATEQAVAHGREAWGRIKSDSTWEDWVLVGQALDIGRGEAMRRTGSNQPRGRGYNEAFSAWLQKNGFAEIDKGTRSRLAECMEHRAEIEQFRADLGLGERLRLNHPNSVWRHWRSSIKVKEPAARKKPAADAIEEAVGRLHNTVDDIERTTGRAAPSYDLSTPALIRESAGNFIEVYGGIYGDDAVRQFAGSVARTTEGLCAYQADPSQEAGSDPSATFEFDLSPEHLDASVRSFVESAGEADARRLLDALSKAIPPAKKPRKRAHRRPAGDAIEQPATADENPAAEEPAAPPPLSEAEAAALDAMRSSEQPWFGPTWLEKHGIAEEVVEALIARGELIEHPTNKGNVGLPQGSA